MNATCIYCNSQINLSTKAVICLCGYLELAYNKIYLLISRDKKQFPKSYLKHKLGDSYSIITFQYPQPQIKIYSSPIINDMTISKEQIKKLLNISKLL